MPDQSPRAVQWSPVAYEKQRSKRVLARRRAVRRLWRGGGLVLAVALAVLVVHLARSANTSAAAGRDGSAGTTPVPQTKSRLAPAPVGTSDPLATSAAHAFLARRAGTVSVAVENLRTGRTWLYHPAARTQTASIMKVDILETLLRQAEVTHTPLDDNVQDLAQGMIENSSDTDAQDLWDSLGGAGAIEQYNDAAGLSQTVPNPAGYWGESTTSAVDQIRLLRQLVTAHGLLNQTSRSYALGLMENVVADQRWGVSAGVARNASVALKNGWVPLTSNSDWEINSIGRIKGDGRDYLIAVLTAHDSSEGYGIDTIEGISKLVWSSLGPG